MRRLRVLMLSVDPRTPGGIAHFVEALKSRLVAAEVTPVRTGSIPGEHEGVAGILLRLVSVPFRVFWLGLWGRYDVIHVNTSLAPKSAFRDALILLALRAAGNRNVLVYIHGWSWKLAHQIAQGRFLRAFAAFLLRGAQRVLVLAPEFRAHLIALGVDPACISTTRTMFDSEELRSPASGRPPRRLVLFMSRFERAKGIHELIAGFARIAERYPDVDLVLAGDGEEMPQVRDTIAELGLQARVAMPGYVRGPEKARLLNHCTVFVLPSYREGMPVALLEALAAGAPVIATKVGAIPRIIRHGEHGLMLDEVTPESIAHALDQVLSRPLWCEQVGKFNRQYAWERFESRQVTAELEATYRLIAAAASRARTGRRPARN